MKRPLFIGLLFLAAGILFCFYYQGLGYACLVVLLLFGILFRMDRQTRWQGVFNFPFFFLVGAVSACMALSTAHEAMNQAVVSHGEITIGATVEKTGLTSAGSQKAVVKVDWLEWDSEVFGGGFRVEAYVKEGEPLYPGQKIVAGGMAASPEGRRNKGGYDDRLHLLLKGIDYRMYGLAVEDIVGYENPFLYDLRAGLAAVYDNVFSEKESGLVKSVMLGDRSELDGDTAALYKDAGIYHIIVISGLHITLLCMMIRKILGCFMEERVSCVLTLIVLIAYCIMTGAGVSTVRAVIMSGVMLIGRILYRESDIVASASFAAILLLLYNPYHLFSPGFQLTFAAVLGIGFAFAPINTLLQVIAAKCRFLGFLKGFKLVRDSMAASMAVNLFITPILVYHFNSIPVYSIFANILIVPFCSILVGAGFLTGILGIACVDMAYGVSWVVSLVLFIYETVAAFFSALPFSTVTVKTYPVPIMALYYGAAICFVYVIGGQKAQARNCRPCLYGFIALFFIAAAAYDHYPRGLTVSFLDVGHGDCAVIENGKDTYIIDGGGWRDRDFGANAGSYVLLPYLDHKGIKEIHTVFVSHTDYDHIAGIIELLYYKDVGRIILPVQAYGNDPFYHFLLEAAAENSAEILFWSQGDFMEHNGMVFEAVHPLRSHITGDQNEDSLVVAAEYQGIRFLFTGDIGFTAENAILDYDVDIRAQILKVAHHGSKYSSGTAFLKAVNPDTAVISAPSGSQYHPSPEAVERLDNEDINVYATNESGQITIQIKNGTIKIIRQVMD